MNRYVFCAIATIALLFSFVHSTSAQNVIAWGNNTTGQSDVPASATNVISAAAGWSHSLALRADGTVLSWGSITNVPPEATNVVAIAAGALHNLVLRKDGIIFAWGDNRYGQTDISGWGTIAAIATGEFQSFAVRSNGTFVARGLNTSLIPSSLTGISTIAAGAKHALFQFKDQSTTTWNFGFETWLAGAMRKPLLSLTNTVTIFAGTTNNLALRADGTVKAWGFGSQPVPPLSATNIVTVTLSTNCNLALRSDGTIAAWGSGVGTNVPASATNVIAIAAGKSHALAVIGDGAPRFYGPPGYSENISVMKDLPLTARAVGSSPLYLQWLADGVPIPDATNAYPKIPALIGTDNVAYQVVASNAFGCLTSSISKVKVSAVHVWGDNANKQRTVPTTLTNPVAIAAGNAHALGLNANGTVVAWGRNSFKQCIVPFATNITAIAAGGDHSLALRATGSVIAWGRNSDGQTVVPMSASNVIAVAAGWTHSLALRRDRTVVAWGNNDYNQTNVPPFLTNVISIACGHYHNLALKSDGAVLAWGDEEEGLVPADATNVVSIAAGFAHSLALRADGRVIAWGDNKWGQTDVPTSATNVIALAAGYHHSLALRADGKVIGWGEGYLGVLNISEELNSVSSIAVGESFSMALVKVGPPVFTPASSTVTALVGTRALLTTSVGGTQPLSGQWYFNGEPIMGETKNFLIVDPVQLSSAGSYSLVVSNGLGEMNTYLVNLIAVAPPIINLQPRSQSVMPGASVLFTVESQGSAPLSYQWQFEGSDLVGETNSALQLANVTAANSGSHTLQITNNAGAVRSNPARLNVIAPSALNLTSSTGSPLLSFNGSTGASYVIQYSTNLVTSNWLDLITLSNPSGSFQFIDTNLSTNGTRFYRTIAN